MCKPKEHKQILTSVKNLQEKLIGIEELYVPQKTNDTVHLEENSGIGTY